MNTIKVKRDFEGERFEASARYASEDDGWYVSVSRVVNGWRHMLERRGPVSDAWSEIEDMLSLAMSGSYAERAPNGASEVEGRGNF